MQNKHVHTSRETSQEFQDVIVWAWRQKKKKNVINNKKFELVAKTK